MSPAAVVVMTGSSPAVCSDCFSCCCGSGCSVSRADKPCSHKLVLLLLLSSRNLILPVFCHAVGVVVVALLHHSSRLGYRFVFLFFLSLSLFLLRRSSNSLRLCLCSMTLVVGSSGFRLLLLFLLLCYYCFCPLCLHHCRWFFLVVVEAMVLGAAAGVDEAHPNPLMQLLVLSTNHQDHHHHG